MAHSDTSALNASGVKGIEVGATATAAGCSGKTQLHCDLSFVFLRPADQKLWVFEDFEALKLLLRGRSRPFKVDFWNLRGRFYKDGLSSTHSRLANMKRRAPACGMSSADQPPAEPRCTGCGCCATVACLSSLGMDVYLRTWQSGVLKPSTGSPLALCWNSHESAWKMGFRGSDFARWVSLLLVCLPLAQPAITKGALSRKIDRLNEQARRRLVWNKDRSGQLALLETSFVRPGQDQRDNEKD